MDLTRNQVLKTTAKTIGNGGCLFIEAGGCRTPKTSGLAAAVVDDETIGKVMLQARRKN